MFQYCSVLLLHWSGWLLDSNLKTQVLVVKLWARNQAPNSCRSRNSPLIVQLKLSQLLVRIKLNNTISWYIYIVHVPACVLNLIHWDMLTVTCAYNVAISGWNLWHWYNHIVNIVLHRPLHAHDWPMCNNYLGKYDFQVMYNGMYDIVYFKLILDNSVDFKVSLYSQWS